MILTLEVVVMRELRCKVLRGITKGTHVPRCLLRLSEVSTWCGEP